MHYWIVPKNAPYYQVRLSGGLAYPDQHLHPSTNYSVSSRHCHASVSTSLFKVVRNINLFCHQPLVRLSLGTRPNPDPISVDQSHLVFRRGVSHPFIVTYTYICFSTRSSKARFTFDAGENAPLPMFAHRFR